MNGTNKFLKVVFFLLLLVMLGELGFFFYNTKVKNNQPVNFPNNNGGLPPVSDRKGLAVDSSQIDYLNKLRRLDIDYLKVAYNIGGEGVVSNLKFTSTDSATLDLTDKNNNRSTNINVPIKKGTALIVYLSQDGVIKTGTLKDLIEGDTIKFTWNYDMEKTTGVDLIDTELTIYKK